MQKDFSRLQAGHKPAQTRADHNRVEDDGEKSKNNQGSPLLL